GSLTGLAPRAGLAAEILLTLTYDIPPGTENFGSDVTGGGTFEVAALYVVSVDWFSASKTRVGPRYDDVIDAEARLTFAGQPVGSANRDPLKPIDSRLRLHVTGVKGNSSVTQTSLAWEPIKSVPGKPGGVVELEYLFANTESGPGPGMRDVLNIISDG